MSDSCKACGARVDSDGQATSMEPQTSVGDLPAFPCHPFGGMPGCPGMTYRQYLFALLLAEAPCARSPDGRAKWALEHTDAALAALDNAPEGK